MMPRKLPDGTSERIREWEHIDGIGFVSPEWTLGLEAIAHLREEGRDPRMQEDGTYDSRLGKPDGTHEIVDDPSLWRSYTRKGYLDDSWDD